MSWNVSGTRFVRISQPKGNVPIYSEKVIFATGTTSDRTNKPKVDPETGEIVVDPSGQTVFQREYDEADLRFVGNAFEAAKALKPGDVIDLTSARLRKRRWTSDDGVRSIDYSQIWVSDFELSAPYQEAEPVIPEDVSPDYFSDPEPYCGVSAI